MNFWDDGDIVITWKEKNAFNYNFIEIEGGTKLLSSFNSKIL